MVRFSFHRLLKILFQESENFFPAIYCLFLTIRRTVVVEKAVAGAVVAVKNIILAVLFELLFMSIYLIRRRRFVVVAKNANHWARQIFGIIDGREDRKSTRL